MTTITSITPLPLPAPSRSQSQDVFDAAVAAELGAFPTMVTEQNAAIALMNIVGAQTTADALTCTTKAAGAVVSANSASASATSATASAATTTSAATSATSAKVAAESARDAAMGAWAAALAANPDLNPVVRMNPSTIADDLTIPSFYNAYSSGPITVGEDATITVGDDANWNII